MPVEVFDTNSRTITITEPASSIYMRVHNLSYDDKMSVRVGNGAWFDVNNSSVDVAYPESHYEGIGGAWDIVRIVVPLSLSSGQHTIEWRFNGTDGLSTGYRIIDMAPLRADSSEIPMMEQILIEDPDLWTGYSTDPDSIQAGFDAFTSAALTHPTKGALSVSCGDCHESEGLDLKYFNMSNESIVVRSAFHGLDEETGRNIASYIRSLNYPNPGRVWNPPYQPGPGVDAGYWSAGAGVEWVLDTDRQMFEYMDLPNYNGEYLNMRELPINMMMPDWFNWLPRDHPLDLWGNTFANSPIWNDYVNFGTATTGNVVGKFNDWHGDIDDFRRNTDPGGWTQEEQAKANLSLTLWGITKHWEIMQRSGLEDQVQAIYPQSLEARSWYAHDRALFNVAPHISSVGGQQNSYGTLCEGKYRSAAWYHLQVIVNSGNRDPLVHRPVDWKYTYGHTGDVTTSCDPTPMGTLLIAEYLKGNEVQDNGIIGDRGWYMRHTTPYWWTRKLWQKKGRVGPQFDGWTDQELYDVGAMVLKAFTDRNLTYPVEDWGRGNDNSDLEPASTVPVNTPGWGGDIRFDYASTLYTTLTYAEEKNMPPVTMDRLARWSEEAWPLGDWEKWFSDNPDVIGDVSGDGQVTALDASLILQHLVGITTVGMEADVSGNGTITTHDASLILQYVAGIITCFPIGC